MSGFKNTFKFRILLFGLALGLFALFAVLETTFPSLDLSLRQLLVFPFFIASVYLITASIEKLPRAVLLLSILAAVSGFIVSRASHDVVPDPYLVARLNEDQFENESRVFRNKINSSLGEDQKVLASRYHGPIENQQEAFKLLKDDPQRLGIVWGDKKWISVSFAYNPARTLEQLGANPLYGSLLGYEMVLYAPVIGLSYKPLNETSLFIASLMDGLDSASQDLNSKEELEDAVLRLKAAGLVKSRWTSLAHRAYPWWRIGNLHLLEALTSDSYEAGVLNCAIRAYKSAASQLRYGDNPELLAAISNNLGLAYMVKLSLEGKGEYRRLARQKFRASRNMVTRPNRYEIRFRAPKSAHNNLRLLKKEKDKKRVRKNKRKRR